VLAGALVAVALSVPAATAATAATPAAPAAAAVTPAAGAAAPTPIASRGPFTWLNLRANNNAGSCLEQLLNGRQGLPQMTAPPCNLADGQWFYWDDLAGGVIQLRNYVSNDCIGQDYTGGTAHTGLLATACTGAAEQLWTMTPDPNISATYHFKNTRSLTCLDENFTAAGRPTGVPVMKACVNTIVSQGWNFTFGWDPPFA
jgi:hypothetical protein